MMKRPSPGLLWSEDLLQVFFGQKKFSRTFWPENISGYSVEGRSCLGLPLPEDPLLVFYRWEILFWLLIQIYIYPQDLLKVFRGHKTISRTSKVRRRPYLGLLCWEDLLWPEELVYVFYGQKIFQGLLGQKTFFWVPYGHIYLSNDWTTFCRSDMLGASSIHRTPSPMSRRRCLGVLRSGDFMWVFYGLNTLCGSSMARRPAVSLLWPKLFLWVYYG